MELKTGYKSKTEIRNINRQPAELQDDDDERPPKRGGFFKAILNIFINITIFVVVFTGATWFLDNVYSFGSVPSESMFPTIQVEDTLIINLRSYNKKPVERGDIIVFKKTRGQNKEARMVKRIIGLPGDQISFSDDKLFINGVELDESSYTTQGETWVGTGYPQSFNVPEGKYFVMGDNRENSEDSRYWEDPYIPFESIEGKAVWRLRTIVSLNPSETDISFGESLNSK